MSEIVVDCRGLTCPFPVVRCKACVDEQAPEEFAVLINDEVARQNVTLLLAGLGYTVQEAAEQGGWRLWAKKKAAQAASPSACEAAAKSLAGKGKTLVFLASDRIGQGDDGLGAKLMFNFLATLPELGPGLWRLILVNGAVRMSAGGPCLEKLKELESQGVSILVCGTCLGHFGLLEQRAVGQTTNMLDVVTSLALANKVIRA